MLYVGYVSRDLCGLRLGRDYAAAAGSFHLFNARLNHLVGAGALRQENIRSLPVFATVSDGAGAQVAGFVREEGGDSFVSPPLESCLMAVPMERLYSLTKRDKEPVRRFSGNEKRLTFRTNFNTHGKKT